jgi:hypothetical protein
LNSKGNLRVRNILNSTFFILGLVVLANVAHANCEGIFQTVPDSATSIPAKEGKLVWKKIGEHWVVQFDSSLQAHLKIIGNVQVNAADGRKMHNLMPSFIDLIHDWKFQIENGASVSIDRGAEMPHIESGFYTGQKIFGIHARYFYQGQEIEAETLERYVRLNRAPDNVREDLPTEVTVRIQAYEGVVRLVEVRKIGRQAVIVMTIETASGERQTLTAIDGISNGEIRTIFSYDPPAQKQKKAY